MGTLLRGGLLIVDRLTGRNLFPADATSVALRPRVEKPQARYPGPQGLPQDYSPPRHELRSASPEDFRNARIRQREHENQQRLNGLCQVDPFAAQVNGYHQMGGDWHKVGPNPLEGAAMLAPLPKAVTYGLGVFNTYKAIKDPTFTNVLGATLSLGGSTVAGLGPRLQKTVQTTQKTLSQARTESQVLVQSLRTSRASNSLEAEQRLQSLQMTRNQLQRAKGANTQALQNQHKFHKLANKVELAESAFKTYEVVHVQQPHGAHPLPSPASSDSRTYQAGPTLENLQRMKDLKLTNLDQLYRYYQQNGYQKR